MWLWSIWGWLTRARLSLERDLNAEESSTNKQTSVFIGTFYRSGIEPGTSGDIATTTTPRLRKNTILALSFSYIIIQYCSFLLLKWRNCRPRVCDDEFATTSLRRWICDDEFAMTSLLMTKLPFFYFVRWYFCKCRFGECDFVISFWWLRFVVEPSRYSHTRKIAYYFAGIAFYKPKSTDIAL